MAHSANKTNSTRVAASREVCYSQALPIITRVQCKCSLQLRPCSNSSSQIMCIPTPLRCTPRIIRRLWAIPVALFHTTSLSWWSTPIPCRSNQCSSLNRPLCLSYFTTSSRTIWTQGALRLTARSRRISARTHFRSSRYDRPKLFLYI